jgi:hypothetical protein
MYKTPAEKARAHKAVVDNFWHALEESPRWREDLRTSEHDYRQTWDAIVAFEDEAQKTSDIPYTKFDINARSTRHGSRYLGFTPLCICVQKMFSERVLYLINVCKADTNAISDSRMNRDSHDVGVSPLHVAVKYAWNCKYSSLVLALLLGDRADTFATDTQGMTAFHKACSFTTPHRETARTGPDIKLHVVNTLLLYTVDKKSLFSIKDSDGKTGLDYVVEKFQYSAGDLELLEIFIAAGADIGADLDSDKCILTTAMSSIENSNRDCRLFGGTSIPTQYMLIKTLLLGGANPFKLSKKGNSSVTLAARLHMNHPSTNNIKAIFEDIQTKKEILIKTGEQRDINRDEMDRIIRDVEWTNDVESRYHRRCSPWGKRLTVRELEENTNQYYLSERMRRTYVY